MVRVAISGGGNCLPLGHQPGAIVTHAYLAAAGKAGADEVLTKPSTSTTCCWRPCVGCWVNEYFMVQGTSIACPVTVMLQSTVPDWVAEAAVPAALTVVPAPA